MSKKIKVAVDIRDRRIARTGARTFLEEVCNQFEKGDPAFEFHFIDTWLPVYTGTNSFCKVIEHIRFFSWKQLVLPILCSIRGYDILFCTDYFVPFIKGRCKTVVVFYDAFFWEYPQQYNPIWLTILNTVGVPAAKKADAVITISNYSREQIIKYVGIDENKIHAIHLAPKTYTGQLNLDTTPPAAGKKYILHIGVLEKRKNLPNLIKAFKLLLQDGFTDYYLVLAGNTVSKKDIDDSENIRSLVDTLGLQDRVLLPGFISDAQLAFYYKNASVYAFVSVNEGFGLPILEAFQNNLPILISENSCLPEIGGDAAITCNPFDEHDIKDKLKMIIVNEALQKELIGKGRERLALFSWQRTSQEILKVFKNLQGPI